MILNIKTQIKTVHEALEAKKSSLDYFTIAFMGKTKAGKSTLHSILTEQGWDAIGVGKQRTTRFPPLSKRLIKFFFSELARSRFKNQTSFWLIHILFQNRNNRELSACSVSNFFQQITSV